MRVRGSIRRAGAIPVAGLLATAALAATPAFALDPKKAITQYVYDRWSPEGSLPSAGVGVLAQTRDGYLWLGTSGGLVRFDGVRFVTMDDTNTPGLRRTWVSALLEDRDGSLWVGSITDGLYRLRDGKATRYTKKDGLPDNQVSCLLQDRAGSLWIGTGGGLARLKDRTFTIYTTAQGLAKDDVNCLAEDRDGSLWIGTAWGGLSRLKDGTFTTYSAREGLSNGGIRSLVAGRDGSLWIGTNGAGLFRYEGGRFTVFTTKDGLRGDIVQRLLEDRDGNLWISTTGGWLGRLAGGALSSFMSEELQAGAGSLLEDREGSLWIGSADRGLCRLRDGKFTSLTEKEGLAVRPVTGLLAARDGSVWATNGRHLERLGDGKVSSFTLVEPGKNPGPRDWISSFREGPDGRVWFGSTGRGLRRVEGGALTALTTKDGLPSDVIDGLLFDREGRLWVGTKEGLCRSEGGGLTTITRREGLPDDRVTPLLADREGGVWFRTGKGVGRIEGGKVTTFTARDGLRGKAAEPVFEDRAGNVWVPSDLGLNKFTGGSFRFFEWGKDEVRQTGFCYLEDREGDLWIGTQGSGLFRVRGERLASITMAEGLADDGVYCLFEDARGNLWMSCDRGIYVARKEELRAVAEGRARRATSVLYSAVDGVPECNGYPHARTRDGRLWFPAMNGVLSVDPDHLPVNPLPPPVVVEEVLVDGREARRSADGGPLLVPPGGGKLEIRYTGLSLVVPTRVRFKYRLDGFDHDWVEAGTERVAHYTNLPPRAYTFRVIACNDDGLWNEAGASLAVTLLPRFWQTRWFLALEVLAALGVLAGALLAQRSRLVRRKARELAEESRAAELTRKTEELEQARRVQLALLPKESLAIGPFKVAGRMETATEVGGDWFGYLEAGGKLCVVIGDATGHGMASGLVAGMLKSALAALARKSTGAETPEAWLADLNDALRASISRKGLGVCVGIALVDVESGSVELGMAGIPNPFLVSSSGSVERLRLSGTPLGYVKKILTATATRTLAPGDRLVLMTDGLIEQTDAAGEEWGYAGVEGALAELAFGARDAAPEEIAEALLVACERFSTGQPRTDDRTVVVLSRQAKEGAAP